MNNKPTPRLVILALDLGTTTGWALRSANGKRFLKSRPIA
jgi:hypothetical protein